MIANSRQRIGSAAVLPQPRAARRRSATQAAGATAPHPDAVTWAEAEAQIVHPARGRIAFTPYPYQRVFLAAWGEPRRIVCKGPAGRLLADVRPQIALQRDDGGRRQSCSSRARKIWR